MSDPILKPPPAMKTAFRLVLILLAAVPASAQDAGPPPPPIDDPGASPSFIPPPPPSFTPPAPPRPPVSRPAAQPAVPETAPPVADEQELLQRPSALVDTGDPAMRETVGLIRIPEMGTNEVLEMLENFARKPILRQQTLPSVKITFFSQGPMTRGEAITAIESLLALNGVAITSLGDKFLKAVPAAIINAQVPRVWEGTTLNAQPSQMIYEKIFELDFLPTDEAAALLQPLMSQGAPIAFDKSNLLLVTDALVNLQRIERILPVLDKPSRLKTEMLFFELQNISAADVVRRFQQLIAGPLRRQLEKNTTVEADERTNQIIAFTHPANTELIRSLIQRLDIDVAPVTATRVFSIRYADATKVVEIIEQIVSGQRQITSAQGGSPSDAAAQAAARQRAAQMRQASQAVAAARADGTNLQFSSFLTIVPDERANTIVASGTNTDLTYLERLIGEIDSLLAQVRIEVVITEVRLQEGDTRGIDAFDFKISGPGFFDFDLDDPAVEWTARPGSLYGIGFGEGFKWAAGKSSMQFILNAAKTNSNVSVLSAPTIVTTHNKEAVVSVGEERPVITSTAESSTTAGIYRSQVQYRDIKLELKVTPLIGSDGVVQMEIEQQIQSVLGTTLIDNIEQPIVGTRRANSYVSVMDGELIVLGGLQSLDSNSTRGRMALLGRIPVIGDLFSSKSTNTVRNELLIFIRPQIIRTTSDANRDATEMIEALEGSKQLRDYLEQGTFRPAEPETPEVRPVPRRFHP